MPIILLIFVLAIQGALYYHDKNIAYGLAYETAVIGSVQKRQEGEIDTNEMRFFFNEKAKEKLLYLELVELDITEEEEYIKVEASAKKGIWGTKVEEVLLIEILEDVVRDKRRVIQ